MENTSHNLNQTNQLSTHLNQFKPLQHITKPAKLKQKIQLPPLITIQRPTHVPLQVSSRHPAIGLQQRCYKHHVQKMKVVHQPLEILSLYDKGKRACEEYMSKCTQIMGVDAPTGNVTSHLSTLQIEEETPPSLFVARCVPHQACTGNTQRRKRVTRLKTHNSLDCYDTNANGVANKVDRSMPHTKACNVVWELIKDLEDITDLSCNFIIRDVMKLQGVKRRRNSVKRFTF